MLQFVEASCTYRNSLIGENYVTSEEQSIILITSFILGDAVFQYMLQHQCPIQKCIALQGTTFHERIVCVLVFVEAHNTILTFSYYILFQLKYFGQRARCCRYNFETNTNPGKEEREGEMSVFKYKQLCVLQMQGRPEYSFCYISAKSRGGPGFPCHPIPTGWLPIVPKYIN